MCKSSDVSFEELTREYLIRDDPNYLFLNSTLPSQIRRRSRSNVSFFSPRNWRKEVKPLQIAAMRNLKRRPDEMAVQAIASEVVACASTITNGRPYEFVCGVPGGSSGKQKNFASLMARFAARELGSSYCAPLTTVAVGGRSSSHPKQSMRFRSRYDSGSLDGAFGLLIDDVATTGAHFVNCVRQLHLGGISVVCVSWIS